MRSPTTGGSGLRQARKLRLKAQILPDTAAVERDIEGAPALGVGAVGWVCADRSEQLPKLGSFVVDDVVHAMCG